MKQGRRISLVWEHGGEADLKEREKDGGGTALKRDEARFPGVATSCAIAAAKQLRGRLRNAEKNHNNASEAGRHPVAR